MSTTTTTTGDAFEKGWDKMVDFAGRAASATGAVGKKAILSVDISRLQSTIADRKAEYGFAAYDAMLDGDKKRLEKSFNDHRAHLQPLLDELANKERELRLADATIKTITK